MAASDLTKQPEPTDTSAPRVTAQTPVPVTKPFILDYGKPIDPMIRGYVPASVMPHHAAGLVILIAVVAWVGTSYGITVIVDKLYSPSSSQPLVMISTAPVFLLLWLWQRSRLEAYLLLIIGHWITQCLWAWATISLMALIPVMFCMKSLAVWQNVIVVAATLTLTGWFTWRTRYKP